MSDSPAQDLAEEGAEVEGAIPDGEKKQHRGDDGARHGGGERVVEHVERAGDGVPHELVAGAAEDDRDGALAKGADEAEDHRGEGPGKRERQGDAEGTRGQRPDATPTRR